MDWNDIRHFLALARTGSVRAAGAKLGVSHSTIARRVEALEEELCARLFARSRDGYSLTDAGREMLPRAERIETEMSALERGLVGQDERLAGTVAITCCDSFISGLLLEELRPFCDEHPEIELLLTNDSRPYDLSKREADIAIRAIVRGTQPPEFLIGTEVAPLTIGNYVAIEHEDALDPEREGSEPRWVSFDDRRILDTLTKECSYPGLPVWGSFASIELMVQATEQGLGIAMLPTYAAERTPALRRLAKPDLRHVASLWLLTHPDLRNNARCRATRAAVAKVFERNAVLFSGA